MSENIDNERGKTFTAQKSMTDPTPTPTPEQIAADLLNAVTDLVDEQVFGDAASRDKAERIIGLVLTAAIATPDRDAIRKMIGDLRWQGSALCCSAADMIEALAARPKVEDADTENFGPGSWRRLLSQLRAAEAKLAECEAELAKADAAHAWMVGMKDVTGAPAFDVPSTTLAQWRDEAIARHRIARKQQKNTGENK